jgi:hypothetical protein
VGSSSLRTVLDFRPVRVGFVMDRGTLKWGFSCVRRCFPAIITPTVLHISSFKYYRPTFRSISQKGGMFEG